MSSESEAVPFAPPPARAAATRSVNWRQFMLITAGAVVVFVVLRLLPTGTNLSHMDFRVDPKNGNAIEFCDPLNPQFIPVVAARSPVVMTLRTAGVARSGSPVQATIGLKTASGKPVAPEDLLITHTRPLHLLIVDATLADYQHVHPQPTKTVGEWSFEFTPHRTGVYRVFGDFTPAATGRGLYAHVDVAVTAGNEAAEAPRAIAGRNAVDGLRYSAGGIDFTLTTAQPPRAGQPIDLRFMLSRRDGAEVPLEPVMGAFAHLVAFDEARSGFAHLHPAEADLGRRPDPRAPVLNFKLTIPAAGRYVIWAQLNIAGTETFVPFALSVE